MSHLYVFNSWILDKLWTQGGQRFCLLCSSWCVQYLTESLGGSNVLNIALFQNYTVPSLTKNKQTKPQKNNDG